MKPLRDERPHSVRWLEAEIQLIRKWILSLPPRPVLPVGPRDDRPLFDPFLPPDGPRDFYPIEPDGRP